MATRRVDDDGRVTWYIDADTLAAAAMLDYEGAPELTDEQFDRLVEEMRKTREEVEAGGCREATEGEGLTTTTVTPDSHPKTCLERDRDTMCGDDNDTRLEVLMYVTGPSYFAEVNVCSACIAVLDGQ